MAIGGGTITNVENLNNIIGTGFDDFIRTVNSAPANANATIVLGMAGNDTLVAGSFASTLNGGEANDTLRSGVSADLLTGGPGSDLFSGTAASLNGDTLTDFSSDDRIVITDAALGAGFTASLWQCPDLHRRIPDRV